MAPVKPTAPTVERLAVSEFRCYVSARLDLDHRPVVLTGPNGAGKTNLLEAVSFLAPGRGLRRATLSEVLRRNAADGRWAVSATLDTAAGPVAIGTGMDVPQTTRRTVRIDGQTVPGQAGLADHLAILWLTPQMDRLFIEGASGRRQFFDRLVYGLHPGHARHLSAYEHAMRERNRLLKTGTGDESWLSGLERSMAENGVAIAAARVEMVRRLTAAAAAGVAQDPFPQAVIALDGATERSLDEMPAVDAEDALRQRLQACRPVDAAAGATTVGPHRTDLAVTHADKDMPAAQCSTGEQKALLLGIVLANARLLTAERGMPPILLLDEVAAHLDEGRRAALFDAVLDLGAQAWMTGTDASLFAPLADRAQGFRVMDATVTPAGL